MQEITENGVKEEVSGEVGVQHMFVSGSARENAEYGGVREDSEHGGVQEDAGADAEQQENTGDDSAQQEAEIAALEAQSASLRDSFGPLYMKIGQNFYEKPQGYELVIAEAVEQLAGMDKKIHANYLRTLRLKGIRYCPGCERIVDDAAVFCGDCGTRIDPIEAVGSDSVLCACCGAKNDREKSFCIKCGQKLIKAEENRVCCPRCGTQLPVDARFCEECGTKLT